MTLLHDSSRFSLGEPLGQPKLLVSVRDVEEAPAAIAGGADILDIKEPARGPLGLADHGTIEAIIQAVAGRLPVSVAMGELNDAPSVSSLPSGVSYYKIGLANQAGHPWQARLNHHLNDAHAPDAPDAPAMVAVAYWDAPSANAPSPDEVLHWASQQPVAGVLIDTADKSQPGLLTHADDASKLQAFIARAQDAGLPVALAGRLGNETFPQAVALSPAIVGVRSAACIGADRAGRVCPHQVAQLVAAIHPNPSCAQRSS